MRDADGIAAFCEAMDLVGAERVEEALAILDNSGDLWREDLRQLVADGSAYSGQAASWLALDAMFKAVLGDDGLAESMASRAWDVARRTYPSLARGVFEHVSMLFAQFQLREFGRGPTPPLLEAFLQERQFMGAMREQLMRRFRRT